MSPREAAEKESAIRDAVGAIDADGNGILSEDEVSRFLADPSGAVLEGGGALNRDGGAGHSIEATLFTLLRGGAHLVCTAIAKEAWAPQPLTPPSCTPQSVQTSLAASAWTSSSLWGCSGGGITA